MFNRKPTKMEEIILELVEVGEIYRGLKKEGHKMFYDRYVNALIDIEAPREERYNLRFYWGKLKR